MDNHFLDIAIRHITGNLDESEFESLQHFLDISECRQMYKDMVLIWHKKLPESAHFAPEAAWQEWLQKKADES